MVQGKEISQLPLPNVVWMEREANNKLLSPVDERSARLCVYGIGARFERFRLSFSVIVGRKRYVSQEVRICREKKKGNHIQT